MSTPHDYQPDPDTVTMNRQILRDAVLWLCRIEDWLLHADAAAAEFADFLQPTGPSGAQPATAGLINEIGQLAICLRRAGTKACSTTTRTPTGREEQSR